MANTRKFEHVGKGKYPGYHPELGKLAERISNDKFIQSQYGGNLAVYYTDRLPFWGSQGEGFFKIVAETGFILKNETEILKIKDKIYNSHQDKYYPYNPNESTNAYATYPNDSKFDEIKPIVEKYFDEFSRGNGISKFTLFME